MNEGVIRGLSVDKTHKDKIIPIDISRKLIKNINLKTTL